MTGHGARYAIYFAPPPTTDLARFGSAWLGYDAETDAEVSPPAIAGLPPDRLSAITSEARRYGFHATLKPPFVLAAGCDAEALGHRVAQLAARLPAIDAPPLAIARPGGFFALVLSRPCTTVDRLAAPCVAELDTFRAPPGAEELARRRRAGLTPRQERLLEHWGYPFVMDEFRFHMTLTGRLPNEEAAGLRPILERLAAPYCRSALRIDAIGLYRQPRRDAAFRLVRRYPLAGTAA